MLNLYRRHLTTCPHRAKAENYTKCSCPIWCDGEINGDRVRHTLKTRDWQRAIRLAEREERPNMERTDLIPCAQSGCPTRVERGRCDDHRRSINDAVQAFRNHVQGLEFSTQRKYRNTVEHFRAYFERSNTADISDVTLEQLDAFRASRKLGPVTASKELQVLRQFFGFCVNRKWTGENIAKQAETPRNVRPADVIPYTTAEVSRIMAACDVIGRTSYERLRARTMVLLLNNTALRVSDVALLARDRVRDGRIVLRTLKTGDIVSLPIWRETQTALDALPIPRGTEDGGPFFFWNGTMSKRAAVGIAERTLAAVFKASGVPKAHAHRFRHTLATRLLGMGASEQEVADILGNSPAIVRKHYAKWSKGRQDRIDHLMANSPENFGTSLVHEKIASIIQ